MKFLPRHKNIELLDNPPREIGSLRIYRTNNGKLILFQQATKKPEDILRVLNRKAKYDNLRIVRDKLKSMMKRRTIRGAIYRRAVTVPKEGIVIKRRSNSHVEIEEKTRIRLKPNELTEEAIVFNKIRRILENDEEWTGEVPLAIHSSYNQNNQFLITRHVPGRFSKIQNESTARVKKKLEEHGIHLGDIQYIIGLDGKNHLIDGEFYRRKK